MEQKFLEIYKLKYQKIHNSAKLMYKSLASNNEMAFSQKKMLKEADIYIQALVVMSLIKSNELTVEILRQLSDLTEYQFLFKKIKVKKLENFDDKHLQKIKTLVKEALTIEPLFIKVSSFFDKMVKKLNLDNSIKGCNIIEECLLSMLLLVRNIDYENNDIKQYKKDIEIIYKYIER